MSNGDSPSPIGMIVGFCLGNRLVVLLLIGIITVVGLRVAPFDWDFGGGDRRSVPVDAIPDIGENQQIVFTAWPGRTPQDIDDQITYPLSAALQGIPKVRTIRSYSNFGFSSIYIIFEEDAGWDWSRQKVLEKLSSLPPGTLPEGVATKLGPDATALGQIFWYTLEGRNPDGQPAPGWSLHELRSIQDYQVRYALQSTPGVAEVASVGGHVREYQIDIDPDAMRAFEITLPQVLTAVEKSNTDIGARTIEMNRVEYLIRGRGFLKNVGDLRASVITTRDNVPITLGEIATVQLGPAVRRGALDKGGAEASGGVIVARHGANPLKVINDIKEKIGLIAPSLPSKTLADGTTSQVTIVPFYDRSILITETLDTLNTALIDEILVTAIVVLLLVFHFRSAILIACVLPLAILFTFVGMKAFGVDANIVALSGIAIAIGTIVDVAIVLCESILQRLDEEIEPIRTSVFEATREVGGAVFTAVATTVIGFLPVILMTGGDGRLYRPLAYTKTFALIASIIIGLTLIPVLASIFFRWKPRIHPRAHRISLIAVAAIAAVLLASHWLPLGPGAFILNHVFVLVLLAGLISAVIGFIRIYEHLLRFALQWNLPILITAASLVSIGALIFINLARESRPSLDEGSFLLMPTTMPHASIGEALEVLSLQDSAISNIPEVESVVGKIGRVDSALDPAPISMVETIINYKPEFGRDAEGQRSRQWRDHIHSPDDIWQEILAAAKIPGSTSAPKLQPIETRLVMLQSGMRSQLGVKIYGPDLETIDSAATEIERLLKQVPALRPETVLADRVVGKPYLEISPDRQALARYGIPIADALKIIEVAIGGTTVTTTVEGRERYPVRIRYQRELRDTIEEIQNILIPTSGGAQIPLRQLATIDYVRGPQVIKSENAELVAYVIFDKQRGTTDVEAVERAQAHLLAKFKQPTGTHYEFAGAYQEQIKSNEQLMTYGLLAIALILALVLLQFRRLSTTAIIGSGVLVAMAGGFIMIWLYNQAWFLNIQLGDFNLRTILNIHPINWSVAVGVGFLALFGIATDDGVLMSTYINQRLEQNRPQTKAELQLEIITAARRRIRPAMMTTATTLLALLPVLTSTGRGSDIMVPMAIPTFGGMALATFTVFIVPTLTYWKESRRM